MRLSTLLLVLVSVALCNAASSPKAVKIGLQSSWPFTPLLQEASEFFASEDVALFWQFAEHVKARNSSITSSDRAQYETALAFGAQVFGEGTSLLSLLRISLSSRAYSPTVQLHRSLAREAEKLLQRDDLIRNDDAAFVEVLGVGPVSDVSALEATLDKAVGICGEVLESDHVFASGTKDAKKQEEDCDPVVVLYANLGTAEFARWHGLISALAGRRAIRYVLRHRPAQYDRRVRLSGFGVEMHLKSTEYKVIDEPAGGATSSGEASGDTLEPIPKAEVVELGVRIAQTIAKSDAPLEALQRLSQNFPSESHLYRKVTVDPDFMITIANNQQRVRGGHTAVLINGRHVNVENVNYFELLDILREETRGTSALRVIPGVTLDLAKTVTIRNTAQFQDGAQYYDVRSRFLRFWNDVENDPTTSGWPASLRNFLRQQWPGTPYMVRRNAINIAIVADLSNPAVLTQVATLWDIFSQEGRTLGAVRLGLVPVGEGRKANLLTKAYYAVPDVKKAMNLIATMARADAPTDKVFDGVLEAALATNGAPLTVATLLENDSKYKGSRDTNAWSTDEFGMSLSHLASRGGYAVFGNGKPYGEDGQELVRAVFTSLQEQTQILQMMIYRQQLHDSVPDIHNFMLHHNKAVPAFSRFAGPSDDTPFIALASAEQKRNAEIVDGLALLDYVGECGRECAITHIVIADVTTDAGKSLLKSTVARVKKEIEKSGSVVRFAFIPLGADLALSSALLEQWRTRDFEGLLHFVSLGHSDKKGADHKDLLVRLARFASRILGVSKNGLVSNGRRALVDDKQSVSNTDFEALETHEMRRRAEDVGRLVRSSESSRGLNARALADSVMRVCSVLGLDETRSVVRHDLKAIVQPTVTIPAKREASLYIEALLDPLSEAGKKFGSILLSLVSSFDVEVSLVLNPILQLSDLPLKQYYRYVATTSLNFTSDGSINAADQLTAIFPSLPSRTLFSMSLDVPDSWIVDAVAAPHDLDNLRISDISDESIGALYELTHLAVEGNCRDASNSEVRGMQLRLSSTSAALPASSITAYETLVMENAGYFQLKGVPGVWTLSLMGRSDGIFRITSNRRVIVSQFSGSPLKLRVERKPEETEPLLPKDTEADSKLQSYRENRFNPNWAKKQQKAAQASGGMFSGWFGGGSSEDNKKDGAVREVDSLSATARNKTINVFSVASGHLYERFLTIMMYTVTRSTKSPVKFWLIKQFLSPQFKRLLPELAARLNFQFELVTYKWPRWLRRQTEKQRTIWGYKILFLDVLFGLDVERVIFVDADQIVREDLALLNNLDLQGAPYAMTPFCSGERRRFETKGFRFWDSGYWKESLGQLPYHISALFVVDLKRFRQMAAGDILRGNYQQLSQDPNSLANLDQDLPNALQTHLTIYSLDESWLYCDTWCSDAAFKDAKSVDLCNNPMTKEAKRDVAKRLFPAWTEWDSLMGTYRKEIDEKHHDSDVKIIKGL